MTTAIATVFGLILLGYVIGLQPLANAQHEIRLRDAEISRLQAERAVEARLSKIENQFCAEPSQ